MSEIGVEAWEGNEWEAHVHALLTEHHADRGDDYQVVPDRHRGDLGLEGFSRSCRTVYQAYATEELANIQERYRRQRAKVTRDLSKFTKNADSITKLLGNGLRVRNWVLIVPVLDSKELLAHCATKGEEVRRQGLPHVDPDEFQVLVKDRRAFRKEEARLAHAGAAKLSLPVPSATDEDELLSQVNSDAIRRIRDKLTHWLSEQQIEELIRELLLNFVKAENIMQEIESGYPELGQRLREFEIGFENRVRTESLLSEDGARRRLREVLEQYRTELLKVLHQLPSHHVDILGTGKVADLLERCPLKFVDEREQP